MSKCPKCRGRGTKWGATCNECNGTGKKVVRGGVLNVLEAPGLELQLVEASPTAQQAPAWHPALGTFPGFKQ